MTHLVVQATMPGTGQGVGTAPQEFLITLSNRIIYAEDFLLVPSNCRCEAVLLGVCVCVRVYVELELQQFMSQDLYLLGKLHQL